MKNTQLSLFEILGLEIEINGLVNSKTGEIIEPGLLREKLSFVTKYWLNQLSEILLKEKYSLEKSREELVKSIIGSENKEETYSIPIYINEVKDENGNFISGDINPKFLEFQKEYGTLLQETKEISHYPFTLDDFKTINESSGVYRVFNKLLSQPE